MFCWKKSKTKPKIWADLGDVFVDISKCLQITKGFDGREIYFLTLYFCDRDSVVVKFNNPIDRDSTYLRISKLLMNG